MRLTATGGDLLFASADNDMPSPCIFRVERLYGPDLLRDVKPGDSAPADPCVHTSPSK